MSWKINNPKGWHREIEFETSNNGSLCLRVPMNESDWYEIKTFWGPDDEPIQQAFDKKTLRELAHDILDFCDNVKRVDE